ncbi:MAG: HAD family hydrolase [Infirmifilum sp.]
MSRTVEAVFFDMGGTLVYDVGFKQALAKTLTQFVKREFNKELSEAEVLKIWEKTGNWFDYLEEWDLIRSMFFLREIGVIPRPLVSEKLYLEILKAYVSGFKLDPDANSVLSALRERGLRIGIITNVGSYDIVSKRLRETGIIDYVDVLIASQAVSWKKPAKEIFQLASKLMGTEPPKCVHVGDDPIADIEGAQRAGFKTIQVLKYAKTKASAADAYIYTLAELPGVLDGWIKAR